MDPERLKGTIVFIIFIFIFFILFDAHVYNGIMVYMVLQNLYLGLKPVFVSTSKRMLTHGVVVGVQFTTTRNGVFDFVVIIHWGLNIFFLYCVRQYTSNISFLTLQTKYTHTRVCNVVKYIANCILRIKRPGRINFAHFVLVTWQGPRDMLYCYTDDKWNLLLN